MKDIFTLYSYYRSSTSYRVRIALNFKNIPYEQKTVHLLEGGGQQNQPEYRNLNPAGGVPTLVHNHNILSQSFPVIEYIDELYPSPPLFPKATFDRAKVRQICEHINCEIHPIANLKVQQYLTGPLQLSEETKNNWVKHWIQDGMTSLEKLLIPFSKTYSFGDQITAADLFLVPQVFSAKRFGVKIENYPTIMKLNENALKIESFKQAHPHLQPDTPSELQGKIN